jgi:hypothetical protein
MPCKHAGKNHSYKRSKRLTARHRRLYALHAFAIVVDAAFHFLILRRRNQRATVRAAIPTDRTAVKVPGDTTMPTTHAHNHSVPTQVDLRFLRDYTFVRTNVYVIPSTCDQLLGEKA